MPPITDSDTKNRGERSSQTSSSLLAPAIIAIILQLVIATLGVTVYFTATGSSTGEPPAGVLYSVSGISLLITLGLLWWYLSPQQRQAAFPLHRLSRAELGWTLVFVPLGILAFLGGEQLGILVGGEPIAFDYDVTNPVTLIGLLLGPILVSPWVEEFLYRGILIQALEDRGWSMTAAGQSWPSVSPRSVCSPWLTDSYSELLAYLLSQAWQCFRLSSGSNSKASLVHVFTTSSTISLHTW